MPLDVMIFKFRTIQGIFCMDSCWVIIGGHQVKWGLGEAKTAVSEWWGFGRLKQLFLKADSYVLKHWTWILCLKKKFCTNEVNPQKLSWVHMCVCVEYQNIHETSRKMDSREKFWNSFSTKLLLQLLDRFANICFCFGTEKIAAHFIYGVYQRRWRCKLTKRSWWVILFVLHGTTIQVILQEYEKSWLWRNSRTSDSIVFSLAHTSTRKGMVNHDDLR